MSDDLKTLKDFGETVYTHIGERVYTYEELKQEAIKHIKYWRTHEHPFGDTKIDKRDDLVKEVLFKYFFNITEEDLK